MIILGTDTFLYGKQLDRMNELGHKGSHNQFRIICRCKDVKDANRKCKALGIGDKVFRAGYYSETENEKELKLCATNDIWLAVDGILGIGDYVPAEEVFCE